MGSGACRAELKDGLESCTAEEVKDLLTTLSDEARETLTSGLEKWQASTTSKTSEALQKRLEANLAKAPKGGDTDNFFQGLSGALTTTLQKQYAKHLSESTASLQRAHDEALEKERSEFKGSLLSLAERLTPNPGDEAATSTTQEDDWVFVEAARLQQKVSTMHATPRPHLDAPEVPYSQAVALLLTEVVTSAKQLEEYGKQRLKALTFEFCPKGLTGKEYPVTTHPAVDTVLDVKRALRAKYDCQSCIVKLCTTADGMLEMKDSALMSNYCLSEDITLILVDSLVANPLVRLSFEDEEDLAYEAISGLKGTFQNREDVTTVNTEGKRGINFDGRGCLVLPQTVALGHEWTISVWTLAPIDVGARTYRDLVDSPNSQELIAVILARGRLGNYNSNSFVEGFNVRDLSDGWHHICVVGRQRRTTYYVDGERIGTKRTQARGNIGVVGNSKGCREAWGVMADLQMFGVAADERQVRSLFESGAPGGTLPSPSADPWQRNVDRQNVADDDSSSYGTEPSSSSESDF